MRVGYSRYLKIIYILGDVLLINAFFYLISLYFLGNDFVADTTFLAQFLYVNLCWAITTLGTRIHDIERGLRYEQILTQLGKAFAFFSILMVFILYFIGPNLYPIEHLPSKLIMTGLGFFFWRSVMAFLINYVRRRGLNYRRVVLVGDGVPVLEMRKYFVNHPEVGFRLLGIFSDKSEVVGSHEITGNLQQVRDFSVVQRVDEMYCSLSDMEEEQIASLMEFCDRNLIRFRMIPDFRGYKYKKVRIDFFDSVPVLSVRNEPLNIFSNRFVKRAFDIVFSLLVLVLVFPIAWLVFAPLIKLSSKGPVFFKQMRSGKDNKAFACWKFRTMQVNNDADTVQAREGDARITAIGSFLRKTSLDELPQFYNALIGNMSVVGPRPHMLRHTEEYSAYIDKFMVRHFVKPGITGWAQVNGLRGETREPQLMQKRIEYDLWYIENWSFLVDLKIVVLTFMHIILARHKGG